jgi:DNA-binding PucR family transcriptional regulator
VLAAHDPALLDTVETFLERAGSIESAARALFVHPNTVRYRLRKVTDLTGRAATEPRDAFALRLGLTLGRLPGAEAAAGQPL